MITKEMAEAVVRAIQMTDQKLPENIIPVVMLIDAEDNSMVVLAPKGVNERAVLEAALETVNEKPDETHIVGPLD